MPKMTNTTAGSIDTDCSTTAIFDVLADERRQLTLHYLSQTVGAVHLSDLADQISLWEGEHTQDRYERVATSLVHIHLPKMTEAGLVRYDSETDVISLREPGDQCLPILEAAKSTS